MKKKYSALNVQILDLSGINILATSFDQNTDEWIGDDQIW